MAVLTNVTKNSRGHARTSAKMQTESVSSWLPVPTKAQKTLRCGGKRKTSPWMYFQPVSSCSSPARREDKRFDKRAPRRRLTVDLGAATGLWVSKQMRGRLQPR